MHLQKRILLIDDDHDHLLICSIILQDSGYLVSTMVGCEDLEALDTTVKTFKPNLIFMDHDMKPICGADLTRMLKAHSDYKSIPVIYFSGRDDIEELARKAGADGVFRKPFKIDGLLTTTRSYL